MVPLDGLHDATLTLRFRELFEGGMWWVLVAVLYNVRHQPVESTAFSILHVLYDFACEVVRVGEKHGGARVVRPAPARRYTRAKGWTYILKPIIRDTLKGRTALREGAQVDIFETDGFEEKAPYFFSTSWGGGGG